jgi:hypothetical protein
MGLFRNTAPTLGLMLVLAVPGIAQTPESANPPAEKLGSGFGAETKPADVLSEEAEQAPDIREDLVGRVTDGTPIPDAIENDLSPEVLAYSRALIAADTTSETAFANSARRDLTFAHLFEEPAQYRGQVVHYEGRLKRVRKFDAHKYVREGFDIPFIYEGWIFDLRMHGANPMCVVFTRLPPGVPVKEELDIPAAFDGYFFKRYRYQAGDGWRESPLLIGHTVVAEKSAATIAKDTGFAFSTTLLTIFLGLLLLTAGLTVGLHWWYRQGDRRLRSRLADVQPAQFLEDHRAGEPLPFAELEPENGATQHDEFSDWHSKRS